MGGEWVCWRPHAWRRLSREGLQVVSGLGWPLPNLDGYTWVLIFGAPAGEQWFTAYISCGVVQGKHLFFLLANAG